MFKRRYKDDLLFDTVEHDGNLVGVELIAHPRRSADLQFTVTSMVPTRRRGVLRYVVSVVHVSPATARRLAAALVDSLYHTVNVSLDVTDNTGRTCTLTISNDCRYHGIPDVGDETLLILTTRQCSHHAAMFPDEMVDLEASVSHAADLLA